jgi:DNA-binding response OmpR family regulator
MKPTAEALDILIVEDNAALAANIYDYLQACGHRPDAAPDGRAALGLLRQTRYDAVVLDWMMPRMHGLSVLRHLRDELKSDVPVVLLTAREQLEHKLQGFESGADDYLVKPVALAELEMRLRVLVGRSRSRGMPGSLLQVADLVFDLGTMIVTRAGRELTISPIRRRLLEALMRASPQVVARERLEALVWGDAPPDSDILRSHMHLLRKEIDADDTAPHLLHTVPTVGYRLGARDA